MQIQKNKVVTLEYTITDEQNKVIDSSGISGLLTYIHGIGKLISGLESALAGKSVNDKINVTIQPEEGYGHRDETLLHVIPRDKFDGFGVDELKKGMQFQARGSSGIQLLTIVDIEGDNITVDSNHPLAGITANFDVLVKDIREATSDELIHGHTLNTNQ
ncbi:MAG: peptidylprolyl isomerase [Spirochaetota bacterium]|nr:peptidylprolyl isomerase [Spirochaetota bacterium]